MVLFPVRNLVATLFRWCMFAQCGRGTLCPTQMSSSTSIPNSSLLQTGFPGDICFINDSSLMTTFSLGMQTENITDYNNCPKRRQHTNRDVPSLSACTDNTRLTPRLKEHLEEGTERL